MLDSVMTWSFGQSSLGAEDKVKLRKAPFYAVFAVNLDRIVNTHFRSKLKEITGGQ